MKRSLNEVPAYKTKDGSLIRELLHPNQDPVINQSLAEATVTPGEKTQLHLHLRTEEIYHITQGSGEMILGKSRFSVTSGDSILIPPQTPHAVVNLGDTDLVILCCCAPPYSHDDTQLL